MSLIIQTIPLFSNVILSAIRHFVRTTLFIACMPLAGSSTEHVFTFCLPWLYSIYACFQEKYYRLCIARAAVNESVCEDSHAEHMQLATAAVLLRIEL